MGAKELFDHGDLRGAIDQLTQDVKANPRELRSRIFLFELLCFAAEFDRAGRQLDAIAQMSQNVQVEMGIQVYRNLLQAETARQAFFSGKSLQPKFLSAPPSYAALHLQAVAKLRENQVQDFENLLEESSDLRQPLQGQADGSPFKDLRDCDDLVAPFLEVLFQTDYVWLPFEQIKQIEIQAPRTLRDLIWTQARVELRNQPAGDVFLPAQYYGSAEDPDDRVKLGRMTDWKKVGEGTYLGVGQRMLLVDETEQALLQIRNIEFAISS
ncbi:MAG: type VI secretion system accessory protein TagJ [Alphaproteobacteria bacterium]